MLTDPSLAHIESSDDFKSPAACKNTALAMAFKLFEVEEKECHAQEPIDPGDPVSSLILDPEKLMSFFAPHVPLKHLSHPLFFLLEQLCVPSLLDARRTLCVRTLQAGKLFGFLG